MNLELIKNILLELRIKKIILSSDLKIKNNGSEKIIEILKSIKCKKYLTGIPSQNYLKLEDFKKNKIEIIWYSSENLNINNKLINTSVINYMFKNKIYDF